MEVVTRSDLGGAQSVVINLSNSLCKYHEVIVVAGTEGAGQMGQLLYDNVKQESVKWLRRSVSLKNDLLSLVGGFITNINLMLFIYTLLKSEY